MKTVMIEVFYIKKLVSVVGIAALLLTGCSRSDIPDIPEFSFAPRSSYSSENVPRTQNAVNSYEEPDGQSSESSGTGESPDESSETSGQPVENLETSVPSNESSETSETSEPVVKTIEPWTMVLSNDPANEKSIRSDGKTMTVTGRTSDSPIDSISASCDCLNVDMRRTSGGFTAVIKLTDPSYDSVDITFTYEDGHSDQVYLEIDEGNLVPYDLSYIVDVNRSAAEKALVQPENQVAEYIVEGGDPEEMREVMDEIQKLSNKICSGIRNDYDKLRAIERWVSANIYYDYPAYYSDIPAETLSLRYILDNHSSVCGGYSNMISALCAAQGIKCWNVHGSALTNSRTFALSDGGVYHEWNFAEINGRIIWIDACWDSYCKLQTSGEYQNGGIGYRYFDIGEEYFATNHRSNYAEYRDYFALVQ